MNVIAAIKRISAPNRFTRTGIATLAALAVVAASCLLAGADAMAKPQKAPGSRVSIEIPEYFEVSKLFNGFMNTYTGSTIIIVEVPGEAYSEMAAGFTVEALAKKGITKVTKSKLDRKDEHVFFTAEQETTRGAYYKYILLIRNKQHAALITANMPRASITSGLFDTKKILASLTTAKLEAEAAPSNDPFKLGYLGPFKEAGKLRASAKLYTESGSVMPAKKGEVRNAVIVAPSINQINVPDITAFAKRAWGSLPGYDNLKVNTEKPITIAGLKGYFIEGDATRKSPDAVVPVFIRQILLERKGGGYFRLMTIGKTAERAKLAPEFDKIVASFTPVS